MSREFCKFYTGYTGEEIDDVRQLVKASFTGEELQEFFHAVLKEGKRQGFKAERERVTPTGDDIFKHGAMKQPKYPTPEDYLKT